jgi:hypothetical protein
MSFVKKLVQTTIDASALSVAAVLDVTGIGPIVQLLRDADDPALSIEAARRLKKHAGEAYDELDKP